MDTEKLPPQVLDLFDLLGVQGILWDEGVEAAALAAQDKVYALRASHDCVGELLAVIHGDGGHYLQKHGMEKACADAEQVVVGLRHNLPCSQESHDVLTHSEDPW